MNIKDAIALVREHDEACTKLTNATNRGRGEIGAMKLVRRANRKLLLALSGEEPTPAQVEEAIFG